MKHLIIVLLLMCNSAVADDTEKALRKIAEASYEYPEVKGTVKRLERRYVPELVKEYGPWVARIVEITDKRVISYTWKF